jgi:hypothetical protein
MLGRGGQKYGRRRWLEMLEERRPKICEEKMVRNIWGKR